MANSLIKKRDPITQLNIVGVKDDFERALQKAINKKGGGAFASCHEIYGALAEEMKELLDEIHHGDVSSASEELLDIAVIALWGAASINQKIGKYEKFGK